MQLSIQPGDKVRVEIENDSPLGGDTQSAWFEADHVADDVIEGEDPNWGDSVLVDLGGDVPSYEDGAKSGDVAEIIVDGESVWEAN